MNDKDSPSHDTDKGGGDSQKGNRTFDRSDRSDHNRPEPIKSDASANKLESSENSRNDRAAGSQKENSDDEKNILDKLLEEARNATCKLFNTSYKKTAEPKIKNDERSFFEKVSDWMGLDSFQGIEPPSDPAKFGVEFAGGLSDLYSNHNQMVEESRSAGKAVNLTGRDKFWHSKANKEANSRGSGGQLAAALGSSLKEAKDVAKAMICRDWSYAAAIQDSMSDQVANRQGRDQGREISRGEHRSFGGNNGVRNEIRLRLH